MDVEHIIIVKELYDEFIDKDGYHYAWPRAFEVSNITEAMHLEAKGKAIYFTVTSKSVAEYEATPVYLGEREEK